MSKLKLQHKGSVADEVWELVLKGTQQAPKAVGHYALTCAHVP